jgi:hypothetical protein
VTVTVVYSQWFYGREIKWCWEEEEEEIHAEH